MEMSRFPQLSNGAPPNPPNRNAKCVFNIRGRFLSNRVLDWLEGFLRP